MVVDRSSGGPGHWVHTGVLANLLSPTLPTSFSPSTARIPFSGYQLGLF